MTHWLLAGVPLLALAAHPAAAQEPASVAPFIGTWTASEVAPEDGAPAAEASAFDMEIEGDEEEIVVTWAPVGPHGAGQPATVTFEEAERPGVFAAQDFKLPMEGEPMAWLRLAEGSLSIYRMEVEADGSFVIELRRLAPAADGAGIQAESVLLADGHPTGTTRVRLGKGG